MSNGIRVARMLLTLSSALVAVACGGGGGGDTNQPPASNNAPQPTADSAKTTQGRAVMISVLSNDSDADGDPLTVSIASPSSAGTATVQPDGSIQFAPRPGFVGRTSFTYRVADPSGATGTAQVDVAVSLSYVAVFQSDQDTPGTLDLYSADGLRTTRINTPLQTGESIFDFKTAASAPVIAYQRRSAGNVFRLRLIDLRRPGIDIDPIASMGGSVNSILLSADGSKIAFTLDGAWKFVDLAHPQSVRDLGTQSSSVLLDPSGDRFFYADIRFSPSLQPSAIFQVDTSVGAASTVAISPTFNPPDQVLAPVALSPNGKTLYFTSSVMAASGIESADLVNPPATALIYRGPTDSNFFSGSTPDAASFLFRRFSGGREDVDQVKPAIPGIAVTLTQATSGGLADFAQSEDGARFYYLRFGNTGKQILYEVDTANPAVSARIGNEPNAFFGVTSFALAHDRSRLVYATVDRVPFGEVVVAGSSDILLADLQQHTVSSSLRRFTGFAQVGPYAADNSFVALVGSDELGSLSGKAYALTALDPTQLIPLHSSGQGLLPKLVPNPDSVASP